MKSEGSMRVSKGEALGLPQHLRSKIEEFSQPLTVKYLINHYIKMRDGGLVSDMNMYQCEGEVQRDVEMRSGESARGGTWQVSNIRLVVQDESGRKLFISGVGWDEIAASMNGIKQGTRVKITGPLALGREWKNRDGVMQPAVPEIQVRTIDVLGVRSGADEPQRVNVDAQQGRISFGG